MHDKQNQINEMRQNIKTKILEHSLKAEDLKQYYTKWDDYINSKPTYIVQENSSIKTTAIKNEIFFIKKVMHLLLEQQESTDEHYNHEQIFHNIERNNPNYERFVTNNIAIYSLKSRLTILENSTMPEDKTAIPSGLNQKITKLFCTLIENQPNITQEELKR